ncbi:uncharacterized protein GIQ15_06132 [Arthroderma uncinatum]|uniref:uncharacterized protein n=1 Tax=Arthroderma uncinatum TaxID=74035 RepID=UPI00144A522B|nr:uncharacterized protein GIQ15_06132 [Arthroderma uncinatum]KAF3480785.1 hypothetical protein GIQ15_06132 [Arthroderma uncinatum]
MKADQSPHRFYLLTCPRTASNLLVKILALEEQPRVALRKDGGYFFSPLHLLKYDLGCVDTHVEELTPDQKEKQKKCMKKCFNELLQHLHHAESEGKLVVVKEHTQFLADPVAETRLLYGQESIAKELPWMLRGREDLVQTMEGRSTENETILSDKFLKMWQPIFVIRHPALSFPSWYRASVRADGKEFAKSARGRRICRAVMTLRWTRKLYDFYSEHFSKSDAQPETKVNHVTWPLVLDADDFITQPAVLVKLCQIIGLDSSKLRYSWEKDVQPRRPGIMAFRSTIDNSTSIDTTKVAGNINLDDEAEKWKQEFGEEIGWMVEKHVRSAMPDYSYLKSRRLMV